MVNKLGSILFLITFLVSCSLDYRGANLSETLSEEIPDSIIFNFTHTEVQQGVKLYEIKAGEARAYTEKKETHLYEVSFTEYDRDGKVRTKGTADFARFYTETEDAFLQGDLNFYSTDNESVIKAEELNWNSDTQQLKSGAQGTVEIQKDDGSTLRGQDFEADFKYRLIRYGDLQQGTYVSED